MLRYLGLQCTHFLSCIPEMKTRTIFKNEIKLKQHHLKKQDKTQTASRIDTNHRFELTLRFISLVAFQLIATGLFEQSKQKENYCRTTQGND